MNPLPRPLNKAHVSRRYKACVSLVHCAKAKRDECLKELQEAERDLEMALREYTEAYGHKPK